PSSTLFPYTTLFRSHLLEHLDGLLACLRTAVPAVRSEPLRDLPPDREDGIQGSGRLLEDHRDILTPQLAKARARQGDHVLVADRSEEHTSELQSREN